MATGRLTDEMLRAISTCGLPVQIVPNGNFLDTHEASRMMARELQARRAEDARQAADAALVEHLLVEFPDGPGGESMRGWAAPIGKRAVALLAACRAARKPPAEWEEFERWARGQGLDLKKNESGDIYVHAQTSLAWAAWWASRQAMRDQQEPPEPTDAERLEAAGFEVVQKVVELIVGGEKYLKDKPGTILVRRVREEEGDAQP